MNITHSTEQVKLGDSTFIRMTAQAFAPDGKTIFSNCRYESPEIPEHLKQHIFDVLDDDLKAAL